MQIPSIFEGIVFGLTLFAISSQIYLFFIVIFKSPPAMKEYRYFLCCFTFWDCLFTIAAGIFIMPRVLPQSFGAIVNGLSSDLVKIFGPKVLNFSFSVAIWGGADILQLQDYCLMYRYSVIQQNVERHRKFMSVPSFIIFHIIGYGICFGASIPAFFVIADQEDIPSLISPLDASNISNDTVIIFLNMKSSIITPFIYSAMGGFIIHECIAIFLATSIIRTLRANVKSFSTKTYKMHLQLTAILIVQLIAPIIFVIIPATIAFKVILENQMISRFGIQIGIILLTLYPSSNSIITIIFVTPFWNFTKNWMLAPLRIIGFISPYQVSQIIVNHSNQTNVSIIINDRGINKVG